MALNAPGPSAGSGTDAAWNVHVTSSSDRENSIIGFVLQPRPKAEIGFVPHTTHNAAPFPPYAPPVRSNPSRYTEISDINSPIRPWLK